MLAPMAATALDHDQQRTIRNLPERDTEGLGVHRTQAGNGHVMFDSLISTSIEPIRLTYLATTNAT